MVGIESNPRMDREDTMHRAGHPTALRWVVFLLVIGSLISAGIYLRTFITNDAGFWDGLRAIMFLSLGTLFTLIVDKSKGSTKT